MHMWHQGETPMHWACALGHLDVVRCLATNGGSVYAKDKVCRLAVRMHCSWYTGYASASAGRQHGLTPLDYTSMVWHKRDMVENRQREVRAYLQTVMHLAADAPAPAANLAELLRVTCCSWREISEFCD